ncbi:MAG: response regulator [Janthinobacterium lividum]
MRPRKVILCVEANEQVLSVRKFMLETRGYRVLAMTTAREALEHLEMAISGSIDLLLSDVILSGMDGNELVRRAKQFQPALPTLLVSNTVTNFDRGSAADVFLPKGASTSAEILERIRLLVARKRGPKKLMTSAAVSLVAGLAA